MSIGYPSRFLVIVRRGQGDRFTILAETFASDPVEVIWDRRTQVRRSVAQLLPLERRRQDRRGLPPESWTLLDYLVVTHA